MIKIGNEEIENSYKCKILNCHSIEGIVVTLNHELEFYLKKVELLKKVIEKLKS